MGDRRGDDGAGSADLGQRLGGWKEIADYLDASKSTLERWERSEGLPVHRHRHQKRGTVFAFTHELDRWKFSRAKGHAESEPSVVGAPSFSPSIVASPSDGESADRLDAEGEIRRPDAPVVRRTAAPAANRFAGAAFFAVTLLGLSLLAAIVLRLPREPSARVPASRIAETVALLNSPEKERAPSLAPDGRQFVFAWEHGPEPGLFVMPLRGGTPTRLWSYTREQLVFNTKWSPRGNLIAFVSREGTDTYGLYVIDPRDGAAERLTTMSGVGLCWNARGTAIGFTDRVSEDSPFAIFSFDLATRQRSRLTTPPAGSFGDTACAWDPIGLRLAVARFMTRYDADVVVLPPASTAPPAAVVPLVSRAGGIDDLEWRPDGSAVVYATWGGLRQVDARGGSPIQLTTETLAGHPSFAPAWAGPNRPLLYQAESRAVAAWTWHSQAIHTWPVGEGASVEFPSVSPDGQRIAYVSGREVWIARVDGTDPRQVSAHGIFDVERMITAPEWSPDGARLAFSVPIAGQRDIYVVDADGSRSTRLTSEPSTEDNPSWSHDGRFVYFRSDRDGVNRIWKVPVSGGAASRVTTGEGFRALESADGRDLFFVRAAMGSGLWTVRPEGGAERLVSSLVTGALWDLADGGIAFIKEPASAQPTLSWMSADGTHVRPLLTPMSAGTYEQLSVAADARMAVWTRRRTPSIDIMMANGGD